MGQPTCHTEVRVKDIYHVIGPVGYASIIGILLAHTGISRLPPSGAGRPRRTDLSRENELEKFFRINPTELIQDG